MSSCANRESQISSGGLRWWVKRAGWETREALKSSLLEGRDKAAAVRCLPILAVLGPVLCPNCDEYCDVLHASERLVLVAIPVPVQVPVAC
jgi:hypothetical protein